MDTKVATLPKYWLQLSIALMLQGCAGQIVYTGVSAASVVVTGRGVPEHAASQVSGADCSIGLWLRGDRDYACELPREPHDTYNKNVF